MATYHYQQGDRPLDGYTIHYALGRGGFGEVYFAVSDSGREVALKAVQNFEEVELRGIGHCMNLKSPHLVMIFDVKHAADGTPWVIMEYVNGPSLREVLDESPDGLDVEQTKFFLKELAKGLSYLHEAGVVHRDLKPHNVFFEDGIVKIGDYSLSKVITASHRSGNTMTVGSVHYMAPEISLGRYDKTVDIYALGVILFEMLTGKPPYMGESLGEVLMKHLSSDPDVSELPEPFAAAVVKAMQRDPVDRFQTAQEMVEAVAGKEAPAALMDSFNPATLSLVGERVRAAKVTASSTAQASGGRESRDEFRAVNERVANDGAENQGADTSRSPGPREERGDGLSHSTAPTVMQETSEYLDAASEARRSRTMKSLHRLCLYYTPPERRHAIADKSPLVPRLILAAIAAFVLVSVGTSMQRDVFFPWTGQAGMSLVLVLATGIVSVVSHTTLPNYSSLKWFVLSRIGWSFPHVLTLFYFVAAGVGPVFGGPWVFSMLATSVLFDWRCLVAPHRKHRVSIIPVIVIGSVAVFFHALLSRYEDWTPLAGAIVMAAAVVAQLVAPVRTAAPDAPLLSKPQPSAKPRKPRLLYDKSAILLELVIGFAAAIILGLLVNGDDDEPLIIFGIVAGLVAVFALRIRLNRRAWPESANAGVSGFRGKSSLLAENRSRLGEGGDYAQPKIITDKTSVFLEFLFLVAVVVLGATIAIGDDDLFAVGAGAVVVGLLALRYRLLRRKSNRQRNVSGRLPLANDLVSILLECGVGICVVGLVAGLYFGLGYRGEEPLVFAAVSAVAAVVLLRFRLVRRIAA